jgi:hypothetical protein
VISILRRLYEALLRPWRTASAENTSPDGDVPLAIPDPAAHLTLLGYVVRQETDGWTYARDGVRHELCFRTLEFGTRFYAAFAWPGQERR